MLVLSCQRLGLIPGLERSPGEGKGYPPNPVFWPREFHGLYSPWNRKESDTTEQLSLSLQEHLAGFPGGAGGQEPACQCRRLRDWILIPGSG